LYFFPINILINTKERLHSWYSAWEEIFLDGLQFAGEDESRRAKLLNRDSPTQRH
jgi:hypothetical protein